MFEGIVLNGVDEGLRYRVDREFGQNLNENQTEEKLNGQLLSLCQVLLITLTGWVGRVCHITEIVREGREGGRGRERERETEVISATTQSFSSKLISLKHLTRVGHVITGNACSCLVLFVCHQGSASVQHAHM